MDPTLHGYMGKLLHVDLTTRQLCDELLDADLLRRWVGGTGLGTHLIYDAIPPGIAWDDPANRVVIATGPLAGTRMSGSGTFSVVFKGPLTNMAGATQANGYFGAFMRFCGYDGIVLDGAADSAVYLLFTEEGVEIRDASHLRGKDFREAHDIVSGDLGVNKRRVSVFAIGPAAENRVLFTGLVGDGGHVAGHNGLGAVLAAKNVKAIAAIRGKRTVPVCHPERLAEVTDELTSPLMDGSLANYGTAGGVSNAAVGGWLPVRNYQTSVYPEHESMTGQYIGEHFTVKRAPCWACRVGCCRDIEVTEGPYTGVSGEQPEYEGIAAFGPQVGTTEIGATVMLCDEVDRLGMDINEAGWVVGFALEAHQRGLINSSDVGGCELTWGNAEAIRTLLHMIARREGIGDILADGTKRAAERLGGEALEFGVYTMKGSTPRGHDHRGRWVELLDTCTTNTSTIEATFGGVQWERLRLPPLRDRFSPEEVSRANALFNGWHQFDDCLGACRFCTPDAYLTVEAVNAVTGWDMTLDEAMTIGKRIVNQLRIFNIRHGLLTEMERPSRRYGSVPVDGPVAGKGIMDHWDTMLGNYYDLMGWDSKTGRPLPETLIELDLAELVGQY